MVMIKLKYINHSIQNKGAYMNKNLSHRTSKINFTDDDIIQLKSLVLERPEFNSILYKVTQLKLKQDKQREKCRQWAVKNSELRKIKRNKR